MPLFRKHRGSLSDSLKTTIIVKNLSDIRDAIYEDWNMWDGAFRKNDDKPFSKNVFDIKIEDYVFDNRTGWYTQIVSADLEKKGEFMAIGFLSEPLDQRSRSMKEIDVNKLIHMNERLLLVLGYGTGVMIELMKEVGIRLEATEEYKNDGYSWFLKAIENLVYLDNPLPPMPECRS